MKPLLAILLMLATAAVLALCGCSTYTHTRTMTDGSKEVTSFWSCLSFGNARRITTDTTDGVYKRKVGIGSVNVGTETEKLAPLAEAIASGVAKGLKTP
jgi:hypothetical protein